MPQKHTLALSNGLVVVASTASYPPTRTPPRHAWLHHHPPLLTLRGFAGWVWRGWGGGGRYDAVPSPDQLHCSESVPESYSSQAERAFPCRFQGDMPAALCKLRTESKVSNCYRNKILPMIRKTGTDLSPEQGDTSSSSARRVTLSP